MCFFAKQRQLRQKIDNVFFLTMALKTVRFEFFAASTSVEHSLKIVDMGQSQQYVHAKPKQYMTQMISTIVRGKKNFASFEIVIIRSIRVEKKFGLTSQTKQIIWSNKLFQG